MAGPRGTSSFLHSLWFVLLLATLLDIYNIILLCMHALTYIHTCVPTCNVTSYGIPYELLTLDPSIILHCTLPVRAKHNTLQDPFGKVGWWEAPVWLLLFLCKEHWHAVFGNGPKFFSWNWSQPYTSPLTEKWDGPPATTPSWPTSCPGKAIQGPTSWNLCFGWKLPHNH